MRADSGPTHTEGREGGSRAAPAHPARRHAGASRWRSTRRRCARSRPAPAASSQPAREDPAGVTRSPWAGARRRRRRWKTAVPQWFACVKGRETDLACWLLGVVDGDRAQEHRVHSACDHHVATDVEEQAWVAVGHDRQPPRHGDIEWRAAEVVVAGRDVELGVPPGNGGAEVCLQPGGWARWRCRAAAGALWPRRQLCRRHAADEPTAAATGCEQQQHRPQLG
jgi:hypothetical protein